MEVSDYFRIVSTEDRVFHVRLWDVWTDEVAEQIWTQYLTLFKKGVDSMEGTKFLGLADLTALGPPSQKAKDLIAQGMKYAREHNLYKVVEVMPRAVARLAIQQAAQTTGKDDFRIVVTSLEEAQVEINKLKQNL